MFEISRFVRWLRKKLSTVIGLQIKWYAFIIELPKEHLIGNFGLDHNCQNAFLWDFVNIKADSLAKCFWNRNRFQSFQNFYINP